MSKREQIVSRITSLLAKAANDGASESEALAAFEKAEKLMQEYNIEEAEIAINENSGKVILDIITRKLDVTFFKGKKTTHKVRLVLSAVSNYTMCKYVISIKTGAITFTGHRPDVELANYLVAVIKIALDSEYNNYRMKTPNVGYGAKNSFQIAMANRISHRLNLMTIERKMKESNIKNDSKQSTALVVVETNERKLNEVNAVYNTTYKNLKFSSFTSSVSKNFNAHRAGINAGDKVGLNMAVDKNSTKVIA